MAAQAGEETRTLSITIDQNGQTNTIQLPVLSDTIMSSDVVLSLRQVKVYKTKIYPSSNQKNCRSVARTHTAIH